MSRQRIGSINMKSLSNRSYYASNSRKKDEIVNFDGSIWFLNFIDFFIFIPAFSSMGNLEKNSLIDYSKAIIQK